MKKCVRTHKNMPLTQKKKKFSRMHKPNARLQQIHKLVQQIGDSVARLTLFLSEKHVSVLFFFYRETVCADVLCRGQSHFFGSECSNRGSCESGDPVLEAARAKLALTKTG
jgi:hypothetical protein